MARYLYASTPGDFVIDVSTGRPLPDIAVEVYTTRTGSTRVLDLQNIDGTATEAPLSNENGFVLFWGPDEVKTNLWMNTNTGRRTLARVVSDFALQEDLNTAFDEIDEINTNLESFVHSSDYTTQGSLLVGTGVGTYTTLPKGATGKLLMAGGATVSWQDPPAGLDVSIAAGTDIPVGTIVAWAGLSTAVPSGWLLLPQTDTAVNVSRTTYDELFQAIGTTYGAGNGTTTFGLPNVAGRSLVGRKTSGTGSAYAALLGAVYGSYTSVIEEVNLPPHSHTANHTHAAGTTSEGGLHGHRTAADNNVLNQSGGKFANHRIMGINGAAAAVWLESNGNHTHTFQTPSINMSTGNGSGTKLPLLTASPSFVVNYIIRAESNPASAVRPYAQWPVWVDDVNNALTATTGLTTANGTWTIASGQLQCVSPGSTVCTAISGTAYSEGLGYVVESEIEIGATMSTSTERVGVMIVAGTAVSTHSISLRTSKSLLTLHVNNTTLNSETFGVSLSNGWYRVRLEVNGSLIQGKIYNSSGTLVGSVKSFDKDLNLEDADTTISPALVIEEDQTARFRNLKAWSLSSGIS